MGWVSRDIRVDLAFFGANTPPGDGQVGLVGAAIGKLLGESLVGEVVLGYDKTAAGVLIESMDNSRPGNPANAAELSLTVVEEGVDQRARRVAGRGVDADSRSLVENDQMLIFKENVERNRFGQDIAVFGLRDFDHDVVP